MVNSGTEATMSAIRLARGFTGKEKIIKFDGCYHGHVDSLLIKAGSGVSTFGLPDSPGVPEDLAEIILRSMSKIPDDRFQSGADFAAALTTVEVTADKDRKRSLLGRITGRSQTRT